ncbi:MAG: hypothetical protein K9I92_08170 [Chitinophagaceae bacterium]|nr:hypothetical protein [Chitinophagaceae bacterium]
MVRTSQVFFLLFWASIAWSQESSYSVLNTPFLRTIRNPRFDGCEMVHHSAVSLKLINFKNSNFRTYEQVLLIRKGELYIYISATGMLYKCAGNIDADSLRFDRIDKTEHYGYNINAKTFLHKDRFYNIGGYGFWRWNGQLRFFNDRSADWKIERLNREIPVVLNPPGFPQWKSRKGNQLISLGYVSANSTEKVPEQERVKSIDSVISLDLDRTNWTVLGKLNPTLDALSKSEYTLRSMLDSGVVVDINENIQYLNLLDNKIYSLSNQDILNFFYSNIVQKVSWYHDGQIYATILGEWQVDSIKIDAQDFTYTGEQVYTTSNPSSSLISGSLLAILAIAGFWFYKKSKKGVQPKDPRSKTEEQGAVRSPYPVKEVFEEVEKALLRMLMENMAIRNSRTATDEVNRVLGMASKSGDMQKRKRSDVIRSINAKYRLLVPEKDVELIDRVKSDLDARLYEYCITASELPFLEGFLG